MTNKVNLLEKFGLFDERFHPKIVGDLNDHQVKLVKAPRRLRVASP